VPPALIERLVVLDLPSLKAVPAELDVPYEVADKNIATTSEPAFWTSNMSVVPAPFPAFLEKM
jgi:hypothetical protein